MELVFKFILVESDTVIRLDDVIDRRQAFKCGQYSVTICDNNMLYNSLATNTSLFEGMFDSVHVQR